MSRLFADGASVSFNATTGKYESVKFGEKWPVVDGEVKKFKPPVAAPGSYIPFDYKSATAMQQKADNTLIGNMRDCGECHVGGGGMEFFPRNQDWDGTAGPAILDKYDNSTIAWIQDPEKSYTKFIQDPNVTLVESPDGIQDFDGYGNLLWDTSPRVPYRTLVSNGDDPETFSVVVNQDPAQYTSFNYFVDIFDDDNDGNKNEVLYNDFTKTGVLEMDCLMCHMTGYSWEAAKAAKREGRFDASRAAGAGFGTPAAIGYTDNVANDGFGTSVVYDESQLTPGTDWGGNPDGSLTVDLSTRLHSVPPAENCGSCHQGKYQVDWKKRGEMSADADVHTRIGCMGCHERTGYLRDQEFDSRHKKGPTVGTSLNIRDGKLGHDPAKGGAGQWDSLNNKNDWNEFKTCADCHGGVNGDAADLGARGKNFGAPNALAAHTAAGLTAQIVQKKGNISGVANGNHLDIISCEGCHITKQDSVPHQMTDHNGNVVDLTYATGGAFVDGSAPDHEGRLATHDTYEVSRPMFIEGQGSNFGYTWAKDGKIHAGNMLTSLFYRDKNDEQLDVNADGRPHGMDAVLPTHILAVAEQQAPGHPATYGLLADGVSDDAEVAAQLSTLAAALPALNGVDPAGTDGYKLKLSWVTVPFTMSHQIDAAANAFGAGGCTDCHGASPKNGGFYKGTIDMNGFASFGFDPAQTAPMTKVNGMSETTYGHPNMKDKAGMMSIPLTNNNGPASATATATIRDMDRAEGLYQTTFEARDGSFKTQLVGADISGSLAGLKSFQTWKGWYLNIEVDSDNDNGVDSDASIWLGPGNAALGGTADATAFNHPDADPTVDELFAVIPKPFTNDSFTYGFDIDLGTNNNLVVNAASGNEIRVAWNSFYGPFGLKGETVKAAPITPTVKGLTGWNTVNPEVEMIDGRDEMVAYLDAVIADVDANGDGVVDQAELGGSLGIGAKPIADIASINGVTETSSFVTTGDITVVADTTNEAAGSTYAWRIYKNKVDAPLTATGATPAAITLPSAGTYTVELRVTNVDGAVATDMYHVVALNEERNNALVSFTGVSPTGASVTLTNPTAVNDVDGDPLVYNTVKVFWGDGSTDIFSVADGDIADANADGYADVGDLTFGPHAYDTLGVKRVDILFYNTTGATNYIVDRWVDEYDYQ